MTTEARQGHKYSFFGVEVLAMESGERVKVREVQTDALWLGASMVAHADHLKPMPMKYFHGEVPQ